MNCVNCNTPNDDDNVFCVNCGNPVGEGAASHPITMEPFSAGYDATSSVETAVVNFGQQQVSLPSYSPTPTHPLSKSAGSVGKLWIAGGVCASVGLIAVLAWIIIPRLGGEALPDHLGMFVQSSGRDRVDEIRKDDFSNVIDARDSLIKNDSLAVLDPQPNLIFYADSKDIPINDLRLIQLDSIKSDGSLKQLDFQIAPVDGKPEMKRIRLPDALANGKYAFAWLDNYFNDGKHKLWAFQVKNSSKSDNGDGLKSASLALKPTPQPQQSSPKPNSPGGVVSSDVPVAPPSAGNMARSITDFLILRSGPSQAYPKIRNLARGEQVYILGYSSNTENFKGRSSPFAQVRTMDGQTGWTFSAYLR